MSDKTIKPAIILVRPQLGENIGKAARAMYNFGLTDLRLVAPRDGWPNPDAGPSAAGAGVVIDKAQVYETVEEAVADCTHVYATTVRERGMPKNVVTPRESAHQMRSLIKAGEKPAIMFGPERSGLSNEDVAIADTIITAPVNSDYGSLNLAQAVILVSYEYFQAGDETPSYLPAHPDGLASKMEVTGLVEQLITELEEKEFFRSEKRKDTQCRSIRNLINDAQFSSQEVQTLRGIVKALSHARKQ